MNKLSEKKAVQNELLSKLAAMYKVKEQLALHVSRDVIINPFHS
jgi:hypothetical protein